MSMVSPEFPEFPMRRIWNIFISRRFAVSLLIIMVGLLLIATFLPFISVLSPEDIRILKEQRPFLYKLAEIFGVEGLTSSQFFLILPFLIFTSIAICTWTRLRARLRGAGSEYEGKIFRISKEVNIGAGIETIRPKLFEMLKGAKWKVREGLRDETPSIIARGSGFGFWGSMLFHLGLLTVLVATIVTGLTLFTGEMLLTEGYPNPMKEEGFLRIWRRPLIGVTLPDAVITLEEFKAVFKDRKPVDYVASVRVAEKDGSSFLKDIRVNDPLKYSGLQYNIDKYGFTPAFVIKDKDNTVLFEGEINLVLIGGTEDSFKIPDTDMAIVVRFYPDFVMTKDGPRTKSDMPNNPVFTLNLTREDISVGGGLLYLGKEVEVEDIKIAFTGLKYWSHLLISRDWGGVVLFIGIIFLVAGLIVRVIVYERGLNISLKATEEGCIVNVSGFTKYFPAAFEREIKQLIAQISK